MSEEKKNVKAVVGCMTSIWYMIVVAPMWWALLFGILQHMGETCPMWMWVCFWAYVPCNAASMLAASVAKAIYQSDV